MQVEGDGKTRTIVGFENAACPFDDPFPKCGLNSRMSSPTDLLGDPVNGGTNTLKAVHVADAEKVQTTALMNITVQPTGPLGLPTSTLTCAAANPGCFGVSAPNGTVFKAGLKVFISGLAGPVDGRLRDRERARAPGRRAAADLRDRERRRPSSRRSSSPSSATT